MTYQPANLSAIWPLVEKHAGRILAAEPGGADELLREWREGRAFCFASEEGALVLSLAPVADSWDLFVRLAVSWGGPVKYQDHEAFLSQVARDLGATRIRFRTRRRGWEKKLLPGWRLGHVEYVRDVVAE